MMMSFAVPRVYDALALVHTHVTACKSWQKSIPASDLVDDDDFDSHC